MTQADPRRGVRDSEFTEFAVAYASALRRTAYLLCADWHLAQDLTQIALAKTYLAWRRNGPPGSPFAYAQRVLMRCYLDHNRRRSSGETPLDEFPDAADHTQPVADRTAARVTLLHALACLDARDRAIVILRYWEDLSIEEVAALLGVTANVVRLRANRALQRLRPLVTEPQVITPGTGLRSIEAS